MKESESSFLTSYHKLNYGFGPLWERRLKYL